MYQACGARGWLVAAHAAAGAGMLAKGPVAVFVPAVTTLLFCVLRRDLRTWVRGAFDWRGLAVFTAIAAPWYVAILSREGWPFVQGFFLKHHLDRLSGPLEGHAGSLIYYAPVLLLIVMPFTGLLWPVARRWRDVWRDDLQAYLLLWFAVVFVFFSLSGTKLPHYLLYGITGLVVLMARHAEAPAARMALLGPAVVWAGALFALPWIVGLAQPHVPDPHYRHVLSDVRPYFSPAGLAFSGGAFALITLLAAARWLRPGDVLVACASASVCTILVVILPIVAAVAQGPVKEAALICRARGIVPVVWRLNAPSVSVYRGAATPRRNPMPGDVVLTRSVALKDLPGAAGTVLYEKHGIVLVTVVP